LWLQCLFLILLFLFLKYVLSGILPVICLALALVTGGLLAPTIIPAVEGPYNNPSPTTAEEGASPGSEPGTSSADSLDVRLRSFVQRHTTPWTAAFVLVTAGAFLVYAGILEAVTRSQTR